MPPTVLGVGLTASEIAAVDDHAALELLRDEPRDGWVDVVVVRAAAARDLAALQRAHTRHRDAAAVLLLPAGDPGGVRRALQYSPGVPVDVEVLEGARDGELLRTLEDVGARAAARRTHSAVLAELSARAAGQPPVVRPVQHALATVLDRAPVGVTLLGPDGSLLSWNGRAAMLLGLRPDDVAVPVTRLVDRSDVLGAALADLTDGAGDGFSPAVLVAPLRSPGTWVEVNAATTVLEDGSRTTLLLLLDVTSRRAAEEARDALQDRLRVVRRSQEFLLRASDVLAASTTWTETLSRLATVAVPTLGDLCLIDVVENGSLRRLAASHADATQRLATAELGERYAPLLGSDHPAAVAFRERRTQWSPDVDAAWLHQHSRDARHAQVLEDLGISGYIAVPLEVDGEPLGVVTLARGAHGRRFNHDDVVLAEELAGRVAVVVSRARRYDREHEIAVALQRSMLTALPDLAPWQVAARYVPAGVDTQVGGDWYDTFVLPGAAPVLVIGDVVGHDVTAAAAMGQVRSAMRALAWGRSDRPAEVLDALDALNDALRVTDFATVVYAVVDTLAAADGGGALLRWATAGHLPPLVLEPDGRAHLLDVRPDLVIGIPRSGARGRAEHRTHLAPGATILLYTDGLVERRSASLADGLAGLREQVEGLAHLSLDDLCDAVVASRADDQEDDIAVLALRLPHAGPAAGRGGA